MEKRTPELDLKGNGVLADVNGWQDCKIINLKTGDIVRHKSGGTPYVVIANYGSRVTAVATMDITNEIEWNHLPACR
jgi:hypothetical protein